MMSQNKPFISIIIPCRNEERFISDCIISLINCNYPQDLTEILIVDGKSNDGTLKVIQEMSAKYHNIRLIINEKKVTPVALNLGLSNAKGELIMISGAHAKFPPDYLSKLVLFLENNHVDVAGGVLKTKCRNINPKTLAITSVLSNKFGVGNSHFRIGDTNQPVQVDTVPFGLYRRKVFQTTGVYNEKLIRNHDIELSKRILKNGFRIYLLPSPECYYFARETFGGLARNSFENGKWNILTVYITKSFESISLRHYIPLLFVSGLLLPLVASLILSPYIILVSPTILTAYLLAVWTISIRSSKSINIIFNTALTYMVIHFSYGLGSLIGCFKFRYLFD